MNADPAQAALQSMEVPPQVTFGSQYSEVLDTLLSLNVEDISEEHRSEFIEVMKGLWKIFALGYIERKHIYERYLPAFRLIKNYYKMGLPKLGREKALELAFEFQASRSDRGFERMAQVSSYAERRVAVQQEQEKPRTPRIFKRG